MSARLPAVLVTAAALAAGVGATPAHADPAAPGAPGNPVDRSFLTDRKSVV